MEKGAGVGGVGGMSGVSGNGDGGGRGPRQLDFLLLYNLDQPGYARLVLCHLRAASSTHAHAHTHAQTYSSRPIG